MLSFAQKNGCPWDTSTGRTCSSAALSGNLEVLRYCHENGCPWDMPSKYDGGTCSSAAESGNLEILRYCRAELRSENGCPWDMPSEYDGGTCFYAANLEIRDWLLKNNCACSGKYHRKL